MNPLAGKQLKALRTDIQQQQLVWVRNRSCRKLSSQRSAKNQPVPDAAFASVRVTLSDVQVVLLSKRQARVLEVPSHPLSFLAFWSSVVGFDFRISPIKS